MVNLVVIATKRDNYIDLCFLISRLNKMTYDKYSSDVFIIDNDGDQYYTFTLQVTWRLLLHFYTACSMAIFVLNNARSHGIIRKT